MDDINHHRNRRKPTRMPGWDYGSNGKYFVTVCTEFSVLARKNDLNGNRTNSDPKFRTLPLLSVVLKAR